MTKTETIAPNQLLPSLIRSIAHLHTESHRLITVICPTNTTAVFLRRQYERQVRNATFVRFTTLDEVTQLLEDATLEQSIKTQSQSIHHFDVCVSIARKLFPNSSPWIKAPLIRNTLEYLYGMDEVFFDQATHDYEIVRKCSDEFARINPRGIVASDVAIDPTTIIGTCIVCSFGDADPAMEKFLSNYRDNISSIIVTEPDALHDSVLTCENPYAEMELLFEKIMTDDLDVNSSCIIVPDNKYKRLVVETARQKAIPLAGSSPTTLSSHPFCVIAHYFLNSAHNPVTYESIQDFVTAFPWINNPAGKHPFIDCLDSVAHSNTVGEYFSAICEFLRINVKPEFFNQDNIYHVEVSFTQDAFALLLELATSTSELSHKHASLLLQQRSQSPLRIAPLGEGMYVALAPEVFGCSFKHVFVCGMNDSYVTPRKVPSSLIPRDQYESYGINGMSREEQRAEETMTWLRTCADSFVMTSSLVTSSGKATAFPHWAKLTPTSPMSHAMSDFEWNDTVVHRAQYLGQLVSHDLNFVNALVEPDLLGNPLNVSPTGIEEVATCPSKFFYNKILRATKPQVTEDPDELLPMILGTFVHSHLDDFVTQQLDRQQLLDEVFAQILELEEKRVLPHNASGVLTRERLSQIIDNFLQLHHERTYDEIASEVEIDKDLRFTKDIHLTGKVDRVERQEYTTVVDYKTSKPDASAKYEDVFYFGRKFQLAIYAVMMEEDIRELQYWHLGGDEGDIHTIAFDEETRSKALDVLRILCSVIEEGAFIPRKEVVEKNSKATKHTSFCDRCDNEPYCYQEQRNLWVSEKDSPMFKNYAHATGEDMVEAN
jgi:RecB family exonuclease